MGWLIPCTAAGVLFGFVADQQVKSGTIESQIQATIFTIALTTICGVMAGVIADLTSESTDRYHTSPNQL